MSTRAALFGLIAVSTALRLAWAASLGPGNDEAYHYLFVVHPDWSYFDHPPMLAVIERLGIALAGGTVSPFSLRLGFILLFAGSSWLMARLTGRYYGPRAGWLAAFALNVTAYHTAAAGVFALPDGPLLFFWLLTLDRLAVALAAQNQLRPWVWVGLAWGGALLSKYHAVFLPAGMLLYLVLEPSARVWLRRPGPFLAFLVGLILFTPVIAWNAEHEWASFVFQGGRALGGWRFRPNTLATAVVGQALYLFPWIWAWLLFVMVRPARGLVSGPPPPAPDRFLLSQAVVPLSTFLAVACVRPVLPHWTLIGFISLFPLLGQRWAELWAIDAGWLRRRFVVLAILPLAVAAVLLVQYRTGLLQKGRAGGVGLVKVSRDPTVDLYGWDQVADELRRRGLLDEPGTFLFTNYWYSSGQLAFATRGSTTPVLCYNAFDARSFGYWSVPEEWVGRDGILVALNDHASEPHCYDRWFRRIEPIGSFNVVRAGATVRKVRLFRCVGQTAGFPYDLGRSRRNAGLQTPRGNRERADRGSGRRAG